MVKIKDMSTDIIKHIKVSSAEQELTLYINTAGNVFIHEKDGIEITDFWMEIDWEDWQEVVNFINQQKRDNDV